MTTTLIDRLRNPAWTTSDQLQTAVTVADMKEAAEVIEDLCRRVKELENDLSQTNHMPAVRFHTAP